jgi:protocatechuate 3,4-dioxygenase beta subunit
MKYIFSAIIFLPFMVHAQEKIILSGRVTNFSGNPVDSAIVRVMDRNFKALFITYSNRDGYYSMTVAKGN